MHATLKDQCVLQRMINRKVKQTIELVHILLQVRLFLVPDLGDGEHVGSADELGPEVERHMLDGVDPDCIKAVIADQFLHPVE